ncbi:hypothetical protein JZ751_001935 [Albula glossodonta]|uniref:G-protein coupled receptors family 1 profile domain-containing protein n=1 Tax=Albula glossodonta TaxID=121402 RepID=A0A8T2P8I4_9TELE|nr:hypothetical protein JZ751_001935 [Albula glossodonta]
MTDSVNVTVTTATVMPNHSLTQLGGHPVLMGAYGLVFLLSVVLNGFALWVYFCQARLHTGVTVYLQNLAAADFFLSLSLPLRIANYATDSTTLRQAYCSFGAAAFYLNMYVSILFMEYIAANRYLKIVRPMENHRVQTVRAARYIALGTWASLLTLAVVYVCLALQTSSKGESSQTPYKNDSIAKSKRCEMLHSQNLNVFYKVLHTTSAVIFVFVLVSLCYFYFQTTKRLRKAQQAASRKLAKCKRNMLVLVSVFCVCFVPYHLVRLPYMFIQSQVTSQGGRQVLYSLKEVTVLLSVLNACLDPFIYFIFCKEFRARLGLRTSAAQGQGATKGQGGPNHPDSETRNSLSSRRDMSVI